MRDLPLFYAPDIATRRELPETEAGHCQRVLRAKEGDEILITDGLGMLYEARLIEVSKRCCSVELTKEERWEKTWRGRITLTVAPTKAIERMEWLLEKAVEIGIDRIILLKTKHSERKHINAERLERIMQSAMKQSQKALIPELIPEQTLAQAFELCSSDSLFLAHCRAPEGGIQDRKLPNHYYRPGEDISIFIGPEGDFTVEEILQAQERGAHGISLGESRLRTETAALVALQWLHTLELLGSSHQ
ncbi:MAG: RsmE family RNA methyltransferase [Porphyromonadaceae bacterium]|nr:RsmE family RNA methyltransferase [Porphyromonadaceae bacterium]